MAPALPKPGEWSAARVQALLAEQRALSAQLRRLREASAILDQALHQAAQAAAAARIPTLAEELGIARGTPVPAAPKSLNYWK